MPPVDRRVTVKAISVYSYFHNLNFYTLGISVLTNSVDGRTRWMKSRSIRTRVISNILDYLELNQKENVSKESKSYGIRKDNNHLNLIVEYIKTCRDPFIEEGEKLFNIATGKAVSQEISSFLLNINVIGKQASERFTQRCLDDLSKFHDSIPKI